MKKLLAILVVLASMTGVIRAQSGGNIANLAGTLYASNFANWTVAQGNNGPYSWSSSSVCTSMTSGGVTFKPFVVGSPIKIVDNATPANTEAVTVTAVQVNGSGCSINTTTPVHQHFSFYLASATAGLQEAINFSLQTIGMSNAGSVVLVTPDWTRLGGTTDTITGAQGNGNITILDERSSIFVPYTWNGSVYVAHPFSGGGSSPGGPNLSFQLNAQQALTGNAAILTDPTFQAILGNSIDYTQVDSGGVIPANPVFPEHEPISVMANYTKQAGASDRYDTINAWQYTHGTDNNLSAGNQTGAIQLTGVNHGPVQAGGFYEGHQTNLAFGDTVLFGVEQLCNGLSRGQDEGCELFRLISAFYDQIFGGTVSSVASPNAQGNVLFHLTANGSYNFSGPEEMDFVDLSRAYLSPGSVAGIVSWPTDNRFIEIDGDASSNINGHLGALSGFTTLTADVDSFIYQPNTVGAVCPNVTSTGVLYGNGGQNAFIADRNGVNIFSEAPGQVSTSNPGNYCAHIASTSPGGGMPALTPGTLIYISDGQAGREYATVLTVPDSTHFTANLRHAHTSGSYVSWGPGIGYGWSSTNDDRPANLNPNQPAPMELYYPIMVVLAGNKIVVDVNSQGNGGELKTLATSSNTPSNPLVITPTIVSGVITAITSNTLQAKYATSLSGWTYGITQTSQSGTTATYSWANAASAPVMGEFVSVFNTINGSGVFNVINQPITGVTGTTSGTFTITMPSSATIAPAAETFGIAQQVTTSRPANGTQTRLPPPVPVYSCTTNPVITFTLSGSSYAPTLVSGGTGCTGMSIPVTSPNPFNLTPHTFTYRSIDPACSNNYCGAPISSTSGDTWANRGVMLTEPLLTDQWQVGDLLVNTMWPQRFITNQTNILGDNLAARSGRFTTSGVDNHLFSHMNGAEPYGITNQTPSSYYYGAFPIWGPSATNPRYATENTAAVFRFPGVTGGFANFDLPPIAGPTGSQGASLINIGCTANLLFQIVDAPCLHNQFFRQPIITINEGGSSIPMQMGMDPTTGITDFSGSIKATGLIVPVISTNTVLLGGPSGSPIGKLEFQRVGNTDPLATLQNANPFGTGGVVCLTLGTQLCNLVPDGFDNYSGGNGFFITGDINGQNTVYANNLSAVRPCGVDPVGITVSGTVGTTHRAYAYAIRNALGQFNNICDQNNGQFLNTAVVISNTNATLSGSNLVNIPCPAARQYGMSATDGYEVFSHNETSGVFQDIGNCPVGTTIQDTGVGTTVSNWANALNANSLVAVGNIYLAPLASGKSQSSIWAPVSGDNPTMQAGITNCGTGVWSFDSTTSCDGQGIVKGKQFLGTGTVPYISTGTVSNSDPAGHLTLTGGTATYTFVAGETAAPNCVVSGAANPVTYTVSSTSLVMTGTASDVATWVCVGTTP